MKIDKWEGLLPALSPEQLAILEAAALETDLPASGWTAVPGLATLAGVWGVTGLAREIGRANPDWSEKRCWSEAEARLMADDRADRLATRPRSIAALVARWRAGLR